MPKTLRPTKWPHFMEKRHKPKEAIYESKKILGYVFILSILINLPYNCVFTGMSHASATKLRVQDSLWRETN